MTIPDEAVQAMPERIYAMPKSDTKHCVVAFDEASLDYHIEYVRADLAAPFLQGVKVSQDNYSEFALEICRIAFDGGDLSGDQIQEIGIAHGVLRLEKYDEENHKTIAHSDLFSPGDDVYIFVEPSEPAPSPRAQALEEAHSDLINRLNDDIAQLERMSEQAKFAGSETGVRVKSPSVLLHDLRDAAAAIRALSYQPVADGSDAARDVLAERRRQIEAEGWTQEHDDNHANGEMAGAAACYALKGATYKAPSHYPPRKVYAAVAEARRDAEKDMNTTREAIRMAIGDPKAPQMWPWDAGWWKPTDRRRNLVKAGALILAEIERLDRLPASPEVSG